MAEQKSALARELSGAAPPAPDSPAGRFRAPIAALSDDEYQRRRAELEDSIQLRRESLGAMDVAWKMAQRQ